jgi:hypothetical protein
MLLGFPFLLLKYWLNEEHVALIHYAFPRFDIPISLIFVSLWISKNIVQLI